MVFDYTVKHDGIVYPAGTDVPVGGNEPKVEVKKEEPKKVVEKETPQPSKFKPRKTSKK